jgi:hypothetical protein
VALEQRQVVLQDLILQRLGAGGDHHLASGQDRGQQVRERLAGAGAGLAQQQLVARQRLRDGVRHFQLRGAVLVATHAGAEPAAGTERGGQRRSLSGAGRRVAIVGHVSSLPRGDRPAG